MSDTSSPAQPPSREPTPRWCLAVSALGIAVVVLGAMIAQQRAEAAHAHPLPPRGHSHTPTTTKPPVCRPPHGCQRPPTTTRRPVTTTTKRPICRPPHGCQRPPTTTKRPVTTTTKRPVTTTTKRPVTTTTKPPICSPPNACFPPPTTKRPVTTTTKRPVTTTTKRPVTTTTKPPAPTTTERPTPTTTRRPVTTTTRRPVTTTTKRPVTTTTKRPVTTTTRRPVTTTTRRPVTTTTRRPVTTTTTQAAGSDPDCQTWACNEIKAGIENGYLPDDYNPDEDTGAEDLLVIIERYGKHNPGFDAEAALRTLPEEGNADRGDMFIAIAIGIGLDVDPDADPFEVADELADMGILFGHDRDGDGVANPYTRPDADPDSTMTNAQLAALLDRIPTDDDENDGGGGGNPPGGDGGNPPGGGGDDEEPCTTGLGLTAGDRSRFVSQLRWVTLVGIEAQGEPGRPWPPHPDVPGGREYLLVAGSPVWPVADSGGVWYVASDDGCLWEVISIQTRLTQQLPWHPSHRATIENADKARPGAGFGTYLSRWDNLSASQQSQARRHHTDRDVSASCGISTAMFGDSYDRCRWELPAPGVWSWQARACFRGATEDATFHECAILARGVEWFLEIIDYTSGITLQSDPVGSGPERPHLSHVG